MLRRDYLSFLSFVGVLLLCALGLRADPNALFFGKLGIDDPVLSAWGGWNTTLQAYSNPFSLSAPVVATGLTTTVPGGFDAMFDFGATGGVNIEIGLIKTGTGLLTTVNGLSGDFASPITLDPGNYFVYTQLSPYAGGEFRARYGVHGTYTNPAVSSVPSPLYGADVLIAVPEPASISLLGVGVVTLLRRRRRA